MWWPSIFRRSASPRPGCAPPAHASNAGTPATLFPPLRPRSAWWSRACRCTTFPGRRQSPSSSESGACLRLGGLLLCRLNSTEDRNFGAGSGTPIEENFYLANGQHKRFFDRAAIEHLFVQGWRPLSMEHMTSRKYLKQKAMWELVLEKVE